MTEIRKVLFFKVIALMMSVVFLFTTTLYSYPIAKKSLRVSIGKEDTYKRNIEVQRILRAEMEKAEKEFVSKSVGKKFTIFSAVVFALTLIVFIVFGDSKGVVSAMPFVSLLLPAIEAAVIFIFYEFLIKLPELPKDQSKASKSGTWKRRSFLAAGLTVFISYMLGVNLLYIFSRDLSFNKWRYGYPDLASIIRLRPVGLDITDKKAVFEEKAEYFRRLKKGPVRPIAIENIEAIKEARRILLPLKEYISDSCKYHNIPFDVLATFILANEMVKKYYPTYSLEAGLAHMLWHKGDLGKAKKEKDLKGYRFYRRFSDDDSITGKLIKLLPNIELQDRAGDFLGAIAGGLPSVGSMQNRIGSVIGFENEINIRNHNLLSRFGIDASKLDNRQISLMILKDPRLDIEAGAAALRLSVERVIACQIKGEISQPPELPDLSFMKRGDWVYYDNMSSAPWEPYGPDLIFTMMNKNRSIPGTISAEMDEYGKLRFLSDPGHIFLDKRVCTEPRMYDFIQDLRSTAIDKMNYPLFHIIALESGVFGQESVPGIIVGVNTSEKIDYVYRIAKEEESYLRGAAINCLKELINDINPEIAKKAKDYINKLSLSKDGNVINYGAGITVFISEVLSKASNTPPMSRREFFTLGWLRPRQNL